jgi:hypothetical protein
MRRREILTLTLAGIGVLATKTTNARQPSCPTDGTPMQFSPKTPADPGPTRTTPASTPRVPTAAWLTPISL